MPLIGGIIILTILLFILWLFLNPIFNAVGSKVNKIKKLFKNQEEENE
ncbi:MULTISPECIES: hypothetical protein [Paenibacillus]|uniref:Uncharacterized protein n=1 Tax=Paenibacillus peoriae TaxID=59893 RepID=A0ABU1QIP4_9BACL|nr:MULTISPECIES: hypothetical protein [Paenibacillus]MDR6779513.1 hypothetical protein [Paenibacillus peoriae]